MPAPDRLLRTLRQAIEAFRSTPGRKGRLIDLTDVQEVLLVGDLHGQLGTFQLVMERAALGQNPHRHIVFQEVIHGPFRYPTGGDKSHQLVDLCCALKCQYPKQVHYLVGNHELAQWTDRMISKGEEDFNRLFREGVETAYGSAAPEIYRTYQQVFAHLPAALRTPNRIFLSHSLPTAAKMSQFSQAGLEHPEIPLADHQVGGALHSLVWGRDTSQANIEAFLQKVDADLLISGHIACEEGFATPNTKQLIIDSSDRPGAFCLFPTDRPLTQAELVACVQRYGAT
ncbi:metallophosphoesterase [Tuwongella immobilis]|uniref:protein-serine/threonine phosphatase n=1 Tax=Tuwongella immobilis TaxID=692036 RepID=A0A6C2YN46_9BACT|nr:metallophosphoesterase [Tuwongella immobilis]VIP02322.1 metallophosphoesterase : Calcineurin-like phosphoesterase OS=Singulisphaera acidiphila (strain ATCC BAA-1392 / DSM 18658 / VKM B-2454 / MOB10) GN=Sinac_5819 PE=4 SV=1: Metallophos [Tuwongella immobilis]VTS01052.1 metallophosphoesterase : Calcineurin-like phosphoesterase OS=Singulisphaera acidiphila (strain ATCC BAA-1392 / DSM 18658 / VKM B-2454 / MOB10) GN=Sinac_5819 PE=4 SV=1: Metallophos [Tuwongella immobilis]